VGWLGNVECTGDQEIHTLIRKHHGKIHGAYLPHVLCFTEHHLKALELQNINIDHYTIGAQFSRTTHAKGGVVIYTHSSLHSAAINLSKYCEEKDIEICGVKLQEQSSLFCIITVYRSPSGNFNRFLETLDTVLQLIYSPSLGIIICGDYLLTYLLTYSMEQSPS
jgi:hypothetical protein